MFTVGDQLVVFLRKKASVTIFLEYYSCVDDEFKHL